MDKELLFKIVEPHELRKVAIEIIKILKSKGFRLIKVKKILGKKSTMQFMIEREDLVPISVSDCALASRQISNILDLNEPIKDEYLLEVSSPGLERPLIELHDFKRHIGSLIKIQLNSSDKKTFFKGLITDCNEDNLFMEENKTGKKVLFPLVSILEAHIINEYK